MVYYFTSRCGRTLYMGKDKYENETLIAHGWDEDVWLHVDDLSSAHVYLRQQTGEKLDDISEDLLLDMASLVKANSIEGCKRNHVAVVYTRWKNLKKTADMVDGAVSYHRPENVRRIPVVEKNSSLVRQIDKTKREESSSNWADLKIAHLSEVVQAQKATRRNAAQVQKAADKVKREAKEALSYERVFELGGGGRNKEMKGSADQSAAEDFEDDFF
jgi:hypothetical protein